MCGLEGFRLYAAETGAAAFLGLSVVTLVTAAVIVAVAVNCIYAETEGYVFTVHKLFSGYYLLHGAESFL